MHTFARRSAPLAIGLGFFTLAIASPAWAQEHVHAAAPDGWHLMQDAIVFGIFNRQGGPRGGHEFVAPNWWMGMASRPVPRGALTLTAMFSLDPATVGKDGYREIFQSGEALDGRPLVDRQHPHDLFMQLAASWRVRLGESTGFTIAGGPVGEPALGPIAFMHRASAADNPTAPLGHHTFDSTHIAFGVVTTAIDRGRFVVEGSLFNGREPDEHRWDFDLDRLDSYSGRVWFRPGDAWEFQVSTGHLEEPEELEPGDAQRTTASGSWMRANGDDFTAITAGIGRQASDHGTRHATLVEATRRRGATSLYGRFETVQVETRTLLENAGADEDASRDTVLAWTLGGVREVLRRKSFEGALGADVTFYGVPDALRATHGSRPVSFHLFVRLRPPAPSGRMWNMRMARPAMDHEMP